MLAMDSLCYKVTVKFVEIEMIKYSISFNKTKIHILIKSFKKCKTLIMNL